MLIHSIETGLAPSPQWLMRFFGTVMGFASSPFSSLPSNGCSETQPVINRSIGNLFIYLLLSVCWSFVWQGLRLLYGQVWEYDLALEVLFWHFWDIIRLQTTILDSFLPSGVRWFIGGIYADKCYHKRRATWELLLDSMDSETTAIIAGDFNCTLSPLEKLVGVASHYSLGMVIFMIWVSLQALSLGALTDRGMLASMKVWIGSS